jgi:hypothetical protein
LPIHVTSPPHGTAADGSDRAQRRRHKLCEFTIGERLDFGDAFQDRLEEVVSSFGLGSSRGASSGSLIGKRSPGLRSGWYFSPVGASGLSATESAAKRSRGKKPSITLPPVFEAAAGEPGRADPMAADSELRSKKSVGRTKP